MKKSLDGQNPSYGASLQSQLNSAVNILIVGFEEKWKMLKQFSPNP